MASYKNFQRNSSKYINNTEKMNEGIVDKMQPKIKMKTFEDSLEEFSKMIGYFRLYPDRFIDFISTPETLFKLKIYQRVLMRNIMREEKVVIVASRGLSKTFINILTSVIKGVLYPGLIQSLAFPTKQQSSQVAKAKLDEIFGVWPILKNEISAISLTKDSVEIKFWNGSKIVTIPVAESARGLRSHQLVIEELVDERIEPKAVNEFLLPLLATNRQTPHGEDPNEPKKTQVYISTASHAGRYLHEKTLEVVSDMKKGRNAMVLGSSFHPAVVEGILDDNYIASLQDSETFSVQAFEREFLGRFTKISDKSMVNMDDVKATRILTKPELVAGKDKDWEYVLAYDVATLGSSDTKSANANSALAVFAIKLDPSTGRYLKKLVNIETFAGAHSKAQAMYLKEKVKEYRAKMLIVDSNGWGGSVIGELVLPLDDDPPLSVMNDNRWDQFKRPDSVPILYSLSSNMSGNKASSIHTHFKDVMAKRDLQMLCPEVQARTLFDLTDPTELARKLVPFVNVDRFIDEVLNLELVGEGLRISVNRISSTIQKDRYSAVSYGLWGIKYLENQNQQYKAKKVENIIDYFATRAPKIF